MQFRKIYYIHLAKAYEYSLLDDSKKNPRELRDELLPHLFHYYDAAGNLVKDVEYFDGRELSTSINTFEQGKLVCTVKTFPETGGKTITRILYSGTQIEKITEMDGELQNREVRELDEAGKVKVFIDYFTDGTISSRQEFDERGNLIVFESSSFYNHYKYIYDDEGRLLISQIYDADEKLLTEEKHSYLLGRLREITSWQDGAPVQREEYLYGSDDNLKWIRTLNIDGDLLEEIEYNAGQEEIKVTKWRNNKEVYTWERQDLEKLRAKLYLETRLNETHSRYHGSIGGYNSGIREVIHDENKRIVEELLINYTGRGMPEHWVSERYYKYEYGEE